MTTYAVIAVALAVAGFFAWHITDRVTDARRQKRIAEDIERTKHEIHEALKVGNVARVCVLRKRLQNLLRD